MEAAGVGINGLGIPGLLGDKAEGRLLSERAVEDADFLRRPVIGDRVGPGDDPPAWGYQALRTTATRSVTMQ